MLLANEAVASRLLHLKRATIHRVHEEPDPRRLQEFREEVLSHNIPSGNLANRAEVQKLLQRLDTLPIGPALKIGFLKSLMRARYAGRTARTLWPRQATLRPLYLAHSPLRRPRGPSITL
jgi:ribonuclease R